MYDLSGRVALVAGATGGMGEAIACLYARQGASVFVAGRSLERAEAVAARAGHGARAVALDVADRASWQAAMGEVEAGFGKLHILVNATGISYGGTIETTTDEDLRNHMRVNFDGVFLGCQTALPLLRKSEGKGSIISLGSVITARPNAALLAYGASKGAMAELNKSIALYCAENRLGIRANIIHPGGVQTPMLEEALVQTAEAAGIPLADARNLWLSTQPEGRFGQPLEIADVALWLASDASSFVNGAEIRVDGAASIRS